MHRRAIGTIAAISLLAALVAPVAGAHESAGLARAVKASDGGRGHVPSNFRRHTGPYWTWYGPKGWIDAQGQYDLIITSPVGRDMVHIGVSAAPCEQPDDYFDAYRTFLKQTGAFYPKPLRSSRYTQVGKVRHLSNDATPYAWVQKVQFEGRKKSGGAKIRGEADLDYFYDQASDSCLQQFTIRSSLSDGYHGSIKTLRQIAKTITSSVH